MNNFSLQLYSALLLVSGRLFYLVPDKNIDHHLIPLGCVPNPVTCSKLSEIDNFKGSNYTEIRISHCPDDPSMVYLICIDQGNNNISKSLAYTITQYSIYFAAYSLQRVHNDLVSTKVETK